MHSNEKRLLWPAMAVGFGLFLGGVFFAYYGVLPRALGFFYEWGSKLGVSNDWRIGEYITFATQFTLLFGLSFELPVVVMVLVKLGLLTYETMSRTRSYAIVAIFVAAAILTPTPDIFTMALMASPMIVLYEICIWLAWLDARKQRKAEAADAAQAAVARERMEQYSQPTPTVTSDAIEDSVDTADTADLDWRNDYPDLIAPAASAEAAPEIPPEPVTPKVKAPRAPRAPRAPKKSDKSDKPDKPDKPRAPRTPKAAKAPKPPQPSEGPEAPVRPED